MSSRASGISLVRRLSTSRRMSRAQAGHCGNNAILMFGIPDKMAVPSATQLRPSLVASLLDRFECWLHVDRSLSSALATEHPLKGKYWCVVSQVPSLCEDAGRLHLNDGPSPRWAGGTNGCLATSLLLRTATSRGKDDHHRGPFQHEGGEIYFWWSEFWTAG